MGWVNAGVAGGNAWKRGVVAMTIEQRLDIQPSFLTVERSDQGFDLLDADGKPVSVHSTAQHAMDAGDVLAEQAHAHYAENMEASSHLDLAQWMFREGEDGAEFVTRDGECASWISCVDETDDTYAGYTAILGHEFRGMDAVSFREGCLTAVDAAAWLATSLITPAASATSVRA